LNEDERLQTARYSAPRRFRGGRAAHDLEDAAQARRIRLV